ncbi:GNAT family N-acetyltransferase [Amycolatopsis sp. YIM 10]|uniref:GNAT family N-acetyltransferase n=1 Tax=Amycolatopsis sp. YIM 10 TaxID=2653857 RepID=UPI00188359D2|nr:GNAT family protein [Amycolatopsis sp. YIM 10]
MALRAATAAEQAEFFRTILRTGIESVRPTAPRAAPVSKRVQAAFHVLKRNSGEVMGFSLIFDQDQAGHIRCGTYLDPRRARLGVGSEAVGLTINYAFAAFNVDRVITETTEASFGSFGVTKGDERIRNVLREHLYFRGQFWDLHGFSVDRAQWMEDREAIALELDPVAEGGGRPDTG